MKKCIVCGVEISKLKKKYCTNCARRVIYVKADDIRKKKHLEKSWNCEKCGKLMVHKDDRFSIIECECGHMEYVDGLNGYSWGMGESLRKSAKENQW